MKHPRGLVNPPKNIATQCEHCLFVTLITADVDVVLQRYQHLLVKHSEVMLELEALSKNSMDFQKVYKEFEVRNQ